MEWIVLTVVGIGFFALIVWINFYALDDDTPDPGSADTVHTPSVPQEDVSEGNGRNV